MSIAESATAETVATAGLSLVQVTGRANTRLPDASRRTAVIRTVSPCTIGGSGEGRIATEASGCGRWAAHVPVAVGPHESVPLSVSALPAAVAPYAQLLTAKLRLLPPARPCVT